MNPETKAIAVHARIAGGNADRLIAGMYITGLIHTGKKEVTALPDGAIVSTEGKKYVFVLMVSRRAERTKRCISSAWKS